MGYHEKNLIEKAQVVKSTFYKRYFDNMFAVLSLN